MRRTLNWYIFRQLFLATLFVTLALTCAIWLTQSLHFVKLIINRGMTLGSFLELTLLLLPTFLLIIMPIALFLAVLFSYNKMVSDREMVIMRTTGMSPFQLARPALIMASVVSLLCMALSFYLLPASFRQFKSLEYSVRNDFSSVLLQEGAFNTFGDALTIYVRARSDNELQGILVQDNRNKEKAITMMAEKGALVTAGGGPRVVMVNGNRQEVDRRSGKVSILYFERYSFDLGVLGKEGENRWLEPGERYLWELLDPGDSPNDRAYRSKLLAEGHNRIVAPLYPLVFVIIALAVLLSGEFDKRGQLKRILTAVAIIAVVQILAIGINNLAARFPQAIILMYVNALVPIVLGLRSLTRDPPNPFADLRVPGGAAE
ncbi:MAG: LPS export ABC transporter permease LptF [Candidatus Eiseniibacteriota bacterium]